MAWVTSPTQVGPSNGIYATVQGIRQVLGDTQIRMASNLDAQGNGGNDGQPAYLDLTVIQADIEYADVFVNHWASHNDTRNYVTPIAITSSVFTRLKEAANLYGAFKVMNHRESWSEEDKSLRDTMLSRKRQAEEILRGIFGNVVAGMDGDAADDQPDVIGAFTNYEIERTNVPTVETIDWC